MGSLFSRAPVSSRFIVGFSLGLGISYSAHNDIYQKYRANFFPIVEVTPITIDPTRQKKNINEAKVLEKLNEISDDENIDYDYEEIKEVYKKRVSQLAKEDEKWYMDRKNQKKPTKDIAQVIVEYEDVKRSGYTKNTPP
ncbi:hypothetical protein SteCoe_9246 [Stentor coeruleus]|uniref:Uncharacterized protein n=1 Tax=Stentor coeruleus TaxID=5963 RepID=A0A1R2CIJ8_9CILI|nr:hypothetical protein SteCoe_9246 [Stentor coeruleus]